MKPGPHRNRALSAVLAVALAAGLPALGGAMALPAAAAATAAPAATVDPTPALAMDTVQQFQGVWTSPPTQLSNGETTDAPVMGNGDVGVAVGGSIDDQTFYLGENGFYSTVTQSIEPLGRMVLAVPGMSGSSYHVVQDIAHARVVGTYGLGGDTLDTTSWMSASKNVFVTSLRLTGPTAQAATITLQDGLGNTPATSIDGSVMNEDVQAGTTSAAGNPQARVSATVLGGTSSLSGNQISLTLRPGSTYTLAAAIVSSNDTPSYASTASSMVSSLRPRALASLLSAHESWWRNYWSRSFVQIQDPAVEKSWYGSLYLLGSVSRAGKPAPGLWGNWITGANMAWNGDYHTNYNYEAPFYSALSTNHIAQMGSYDAPVLDYMPAGEALAAANGDKGVLYPVGILPNGRDDGPGTLWNQKSNAVFLASDMVMEYEYSRSAAYAAKVLPYLKRVALFWQNYLTLDNGTYIDENDAPQENNPYPQTNNAVSLALVHLLLTGLVDMSTALGENSALIPTWEQINAHLAPQPTTTQSGETVFAEASQGAGFVNDGNDVDIQSVYPGSRVGLDSNPALLQEAQNTISQLTSAWDGGNAPATFYAAAADVGYNPSTILSNMHDEATSESYNNMAIHHGGGGIENINVIASGLDEMLLQSFQKDIKVFPDWPAYTSAKFGDLLAYGDFLISSGIANNTVQYVQAVSQRGGKYTFTSPWPGQNIQYYRNGTNEGTLSGTTITLQTSVGETIDLAPAGTGLSAIDTELATPVVGPSLRGVPDLVTPVVTQVSPPAGSLQVELDNQTNTASTVTALDWKLGSDSGTQALNTAIAAQSSATVTVDVGSPTFGTTYPFTVVSVDSGGQTSAPLSGHVSFLPVVQDSLGSSWSLSQVQAGPSVTLGNWGGVGSAQAPAGLSGQVWFDWDSSYLYVTADINDDNFSEPATGGDIWQGDSLQVAATTGVPGSSATVSDASANGHYEYGAALTPQGAQVYRWTAPAGVATGQVTDAPVTITRDDAANTTLYELALPWSDLTSAVQPAAGTVFSISALLNDTDNGVREGFLQWGGGIGSDKDVGEFNMAQLMPAS